MSSRSAVPQWAQHASWYSVMVSRFRNGEPANDAKPTVPWIWRWHTPFDDEPGGFLQWLTYNTRHYGGDLQGLRERLPYLRDLGVNALYLLPIFSAGTEHKYGVNDFRHIDDSLAIPGSRDRLRGETDAPATWQWSDSDKLFLEFLYHAHAMGFKVILDGCFNHVGIDHYAFQDVLKHGRKSRYADWFEIEQWEPDIQWNAWEGHSDTLVNLAEKNDDFVKPVREHIFAIVRRWMDPDGDGDPSDGIDGWRLDAPKRVPHGFWKQFCALVQRINPQAFMLGEIWHDAQPWTEDGMHGMTHYFFTKRTREFAINIQRAMPPSVYAGALDEMLTWYPEENTRVQALLLSSHDIDRIASAAVNPDHAVDIGTRPRENDLYQERAPLPDEYQRVKLATLLQFTYVGAPMIWQGDEVGMFGANDPHSRKPMVWKDLEPYDDPDEHVREDMLDLHRRLLAIRNTLSALRLGDFRVLLADDYANTLAFRRHHQHQTAYVVINNHPERSQTIRVPCDVPDETALIDLLNPGEADLRAADSDKPAGRAVVVPAINPAPPTIVKNGRIEITLRPKWGAILIAAEELPPTGNSA